MSNRSLAAVVIVTAVAFLVLTAIASTAGMNIPLS